MLQLHHWVCGTMLISTLDILRSPCGARLELRDATIQRGELWAGDLICSATGRAYAVCNGNAHVYDEEDVSPLLAADSAHMEAYAKVMYASLSGEHATRDKIYRHARAVMTEFMFSVLRYSKPRDRRVLEIGAWSGDIIQQIAPLGFHCVGHDFSHSVQDAAYERSRVFYDRVKSPMSRLPFADGSFDLVYMHATLHHALPNRQADFEWHNPCNLVDCLREIGRVQKPEGAFFLLGEGVYPEGISVADRQHEKLAQEGKTPYEAWYTLSEYESAFAQSGTYPNLMVNQTDGWLDMHGYSRDLVRIPMVSTSDRIDLSNYSALPFIIAKNCGLRWRRMLPSWITPRRKFGNDPYGYIKLGVGRMAQRMRAYNPHAFRP